MRYIDFTVQSLLVLLALGLLVFTWGDSAWPAPVLMAQMFLGPWQVLSSFIGVASGTSAHRQKVIHLTASMIYLALWIAAAKIGPAMNYSWGDTLTMFFLIVPPWILALYYYRITWRIAFPSYKKNGNFLSHINF